MGGGVHDFCTHCGAPLGESDRFCGACGGVVPGELDGAVGRHARPTPAEAAKAAAVARRPRRWPAIAVTALLVAAVAAGGVWLANRAGSPNSEAATVAVESTTTALSSTLSSTATTEALELAYSEAQLAEIFGDAVFRVEVSGCGFEGSGSGFAVDEHHVVTNWHVVESDTEPTLVSRSGERLQGRVIGWSEVPDIAVIEVRSELSPVLQWAAANSLTEGDRIIALGYPLPDMAFSVTPGAILSFDTSSGFREAIRTDASVDRGSSGGPALTSAGLVAGVVTEIDLNREGFQFVPRIYTGAALQDSVDRFIAVPRDVRASCLSPDIEVGPSDDGTYPDPYDPFWTVILASVDVSNEEFSRALDVADAAQAVGIDAQILFSSDFPSLNPGYWVVYAGYFDTDDEARAYCQSIKPLVGSCYHRLVSWDPSTR